MKWKNLGGPRRSEIIPRALLVELDSTVKKGCGSLMDSPCQDQHEQVGKRSGKSILGGGARGVCSVAGEVTCA